MVGYQFWEEWESAAEIKKNEICCQRDFNFWKFKGPFNKKIRK